MVFSSNIISIQYIFYSSIIVLSGNILLSLIPILRLICKWITSVFCQLFVWQNTIITISYLICKKTLNTTSWLSLSILKSRQIPKDPLIPITLFLIICVMLKLLIQVTCRHFNPTSDRNKHNQGAYW